MNQTTAEFLNELRVQDNDDKENQFDIDTYCEYWQNHEPDVDID